MRSSVTRWKGNSFTTFRWERTTCSPSATPAECTLSIRPDSDKRIEVRTRDSCSGACGEPHVAGFVAGLGLTVATPAARWSATGAPHVHIRFGGSRPRRPVGARCHVSHGAGAWEGQVMSEPSGSCYQMCLKLWHGAMVPCRKAEVIRVITAIFLSQTLEAANNDVDLMLGQWKGAVEHVLEAASLEVFAKSFVA